MPRSGRKSLKAGNAPEAKTERAKRYEAALAMSAALTEHVSDKLTSDAIELIFAEVASGRAPPRIVELLLLWGPPLEFLMSVVAAMETELLSPHCDVSALKVELAKAILAGAEITGATERRSPCHLHRARRSPPGPHQYIKECRAERTGKSTRSGPQRVAEKLTPSWRGQARGRILGTLRFQCIECSGDDLVIFGPGLNC